LTQGFAEAAQIGEAFSGSGQNAAHVNSVLGRRGGTVEAAWIGALAMPRQGHTPFITVVQPNRPVRPWTLFVNKADIRGERHATLTWGAAQAGVAEGVLRAVGDGVVPVAEASFLLLIAAVWVDWAADDADAVFVNNRDSMYRALQAGAAGLPAVEEVLTARDQAWNPFFPPRPVPA